MLPIIPSSNNTKKKKKRPRVLPSSAASKKKKKAAGSAPSSSAAPSSEASGVANDAKAVTKFDESNSSAPAAAAAAEPAAGAAAEAVADAKKAAINVVGAASGPKVAPLSTATSTAARATSFVPIRRKAPSPPPPLDGGLKVAAKLMPTPPSIAKADIATGAALAVNPSVKAAISTNNVIVTNNMEEPAAEKEGGEKEQQSTKKDDATGSISAPLPAVLPAVVVKAKPKAKKKLIKPVRPSAKGKNKAVKKSMATLDAMDAKQAATAETSTRATEEMDNVVKPVSASEGTIATEAAKEITPTSKNVPPSENAKPAEPAAPLAAAVLPPVAALPVEPKSKKKVSRVIRPIKPKKKKVGKPIDASPGKKKNELAKQSLASTAAAASSNDNVLSGETAISLDAPAAAATTFASPRETKAAEAQDAFIPTAPNNDNIGNEHHEEEDPLILAAEAAAALMDDLPENAAGTVDIGDIPLELIEDHVATAADQIDRAAEGDDDGSEAWGDDDMDVEKEKQSKRQRSRQEEEDEEEWVPEETNEKRKQDSNTKRAINEDHVEDEFAAMPLPGMDKEWSPAKQKGTEDECSINLLPSKSETFTMNLEEKVNALGDASKVKTFESKMPSDALGIPTSQKEFMKQYYRVDAKDQFGGVLRDEDEEIVEEDDESDEEARPKKKKESAAPDKDVDSHGKENEVNEDGNEGKVEEEADIETLPDMVVGAGVKSLGTICANIPRNFTDPEKTKKNKLKKLRRKDGKAKNVSFSEKDEVQFLPDGEEDNLVADSTAADAEGEGDQADAAETNNEVEGDGAAAAGDEQESNAPADDALADNAQADEPPAGPQVEVDADGNIIIAEDSLLANPETRVSSKQIDAELGGTVLDEGETSTQIGIVNARYDQYMTKLRPTPRRWSVAETKIFYRALTQCGLDFAMIQMGFLPERNRSQLKRKFKTEQKKNGRLVDMCLDPKCQVKLDLSVFGDDLEIPDEAPTFDPVKQIDSPKQEVKRSNSPVLPGGGAGLKCTDDSTMNGSKFDHLFDGEEEVVEEEFDASSTGRDVATTLTSVKKFGDSDTHTVQRAKSKEVDNSHKLSSNNNSSSAKKARDEVPTLVPLAPVAPGKKKAKKAKFKVKPGKPKKGGAKKPPAKKKK